MPFNLNLPLGEDADSTSTRNKIQLTRSIRGGYIKDKVIAHGLVATILAELPRNEEVVGASGVDPKSGVRGSSAGPTRPTPRREWVLAWEFKAQELAQESGQQR